MIILVEVNVDGFLWKCVKKVCFMAKITMRNNSPLVKYIGHF